jgi:hypothetical protein
MDKAGISIFPVERRFHSADAAFRKTSHFATEVMAVRVFNPL